MHRTHTTLELFDRWNHQKQVIDTRKKYPSFKEGEIWWCAVGRNIGREVYGKGTRFTRPVYILKKVAKEMFLGIPLTSQKKVGTWFHEIETVKGTHYAVLPQIRLFGSERLLEYRVTIPEPNQEKIRQSLKKYLQL